MEQDNQKVWVGLIQTAASASKNDNIEKTVAQVRTAAERGAQIVCLQELFASPYFCQSTHASTFDLAESVSGPTIETMTQIAGELGIVLIVPFFEKRTAGLYHNSAAVIDADGTLLGVYRKMHIPDDPQFHEKYYFAPGDNGFQAWGTKFGRIGVCICWDQWYPESARLTALQGANLLFYPTAIGCLPSDRDAGLRDAQTDAWITIQRSHAIANGVFVAAANRIGFEQDEAGEGIDFWGQSFIADPAGRIVCQAGSENEEILIAELDFSDIERQRRGWPFLRDRRIDAYEGLLKRFGDR